MNDEQKVGKLGTRPPYCSPALFGLKRVQHRQSKRIAEHPLSQLEAYAMVALIRLGFVWIPSPAYDAA
jgi:hypothetical protein